MMELGSNGGEKVDGDMKSGKLEGGGGVSSLLRFM